MKIADLFFQALLDDGQLQIDAGKSGLKAGQALGQKMSSGIASNLKTAAFTAIAVGSAIASRGLLELNSIQADFQAATGASADEADRAGKAINAMGGRNLQSLREIGATLTAVYTDLHLTGEAADKTTEAFLRYAEATKQDSTVAVGQFRDLLNAWNLTADQSQIIMDKLVVSHQRYGGSIEQNQTDLARLAPQLIAANLSIDDGIGLLNLFTASGLDASVATRALNTAVTKLKPGQSLNDLIAQITKIENPTLRAQAAVKLFGARGGVALANVLKPGITSLKDFEISTTDAAGASDKAAKVIEDTWGNRIKLAIKGAGAAIIGFGQTIGPLGSALTGLVSIAGALGPKLGPALAGAWKVAAGSAILGGAIGAASDLAATAYLKALIAGDAIGGALSKGWAAASGRVLAAATALGASSFAAVAAPFLIPIIATVVIAAILPTSGTYADVKAEAEQKLGEQLAKIDTSTWGLKTGKQTGEKAGDAMVKAWRDAVLDRAKSDLPAAITLATKGAFGSDLAAQSDYARAWARRVGNLMGEAVAQGVRQTRSVVDTAWTDLIDGLSHRLGRSEEFARDIGRLLSKSLRDGLKSSDPAVKHQAEYTKQIILDRLEQLATGGTKIGKKSMTLLQQAIRSKDPDISAAARRIVATADAQLAKLAKGGTAAGKNAGQNLADGLDSKLGAVKAAAFRLIQAALAQFNTTGKLGDKHFATGGHYAAGEPRIVGERGPEWDVPDHSGTIIPFVTPQTRAQTANVSAGSNGGPGSSGGGDTINVNLLDRLPVHSVRDIGSSLRMLGEQNYLKPRRPRTA